MIICSNDAGKTFYPRAWNFNAARILDAIADKVKNAGGRVKPLTSYFAVDGTLIDCIREYKNRVERLETAVELYGTDNELRNNALQEYRDKLAHYESIPQEPIEMHFSSYITFIIDDVYYYFEIDDNYFFPFYYKKVKTDGIRVSKDYYLEEEPKKWLFDELIRCDCSDDIIEKAADMLFNSLLSLPMSGKARRDAVRRRVHNTYNNGYHYEKITNAVPERFDKIDF